MVIIKIAEGTILSYVIEGEISIGLRIFTVAGIAVLVAATLVLFYVVNDKYYKYKIRRCEHMGIKPDTTEIGIFPLIAKAARKKFENKKADFYNCNKV